MIEIVHPGLLALVVDQGRYGHTAIGVPPSAALDGYACGALNYLLDTERAPVLEVIGANLCIKFHSDVTCGLTGARVKAFLDDRPLGSWKSFLAREGNTLRIEEVLEGFRYYLGFSSPLEMEKIMDSYTTNLECRFGGHQGRALRKGDRLSLRERRLTEARLIPESAIPAMDPPHRLRFMAGPEMHSFQEESIQPFLVGGEEAFYKVSSRLNRTGIGLEGKPMVFRTDVEKSIISEGIFPGTIQVPGDGQPMVMLYERTIGGYARLGMIAKADLDRLAHLKPNDPVVLEMISLSQAEEIWKKKLEKIRSYLA